MAQPIHPLPMSAISQSRSICSIPSSLFFVCPSMSCSSNPCPIPRCICGGTSTHRDRPHSCLGAPPFPLRVFDMKFVHHPSTGAATCVHRPMPPHSITSIRDFVFQKSAIWLPISEGHGAAGWGCDTRLWVVRELGTQKGRGVVPQPSWSTIGMMIRDWTRNPGYESS